MSKNWWVHQIFWLVSPLLLVVGAANYLLAGQSIIGHKLNNAFGWYIIEWAAVPLIPLAMYVYLAHCRRSIAWLRFFPLFFGFGILFLGLTGILTGQYEIGSYLDYLWIGEIPTQVMRVVDANWKLISVGGVAIAMMLGAIYEA